jgi:hypothetical protein
VQSVNKTSGVERQPMMQTNNNSFMEFQNKATPENQTLLQKPPEMLANQAK